MSLKRFRPSPLGLCGSRLASSNLVSMELCRSERREWLLAGSLEPRDVDLVASSVRGGSDRFASSDRLDVLENDLWASSERLEALDRDSERRECCEVECSSRLLGLLSHALPLRAGINVVEDPPSGIENSGGGVSCCRSRFRRSASSSMLSPLSRRPSEGIMVVDAEVWRVELWVEFMESEKRMFLTAASSTP